MAFKVARVIYYIDSPKYSRKYFLDAWIAVSKKNQSFFTHGFIDINTMVETIVYLLHESLNFSDLSDAAVLILFRRPRRLQHLQETCTREILAQKVSKL